MRIKTKIKTVFHHLTKDELIENYWLIICCKTKTASRKGKKDKKMK
jgi:uncharacterized protein YndB with AHSA1/START domain